jgi:hypothetical protein
MDMRRLRQRRYCGEGRGIVNGIMLIESRKETIYKEAMKIGK